MLNGLTCLLIDQNPNDGVLLRRELLSEFPELSFYQSSPLQPSQEWMPQGVQPRLCILVWESNGGKGEAVLKELMHIWPLTEVLVFFRDSKGQDRFKAEIHGMKIAIRGVSQNLPELLFQAREVLLTKRLTPNAPLPSPTNTGPESAAEGEFEEGPWNLMPFGVAVVSTLTNRLLFANHYLCNVLGIRSSAVRGFALEDIHPVDAVRKIVASMRLASRGRSPGTVEALVNPRKGRSLIMDLLVGFAGTTPNDCLPIYYLDATERRSLERKLRRVADAVADAESGQQFFQGLVMGLAMVLDIDIALVGQVKAGAVKTLAGWVDGKLCQDLTMPVTDFPAERVIKRHLICVTKDFRKEFPAASWMVERKVQSYMGLPVTNAAGQVVGILQIMHRGPLSKTKDLRAVLLIFATRVAAEMARLATEEVLVERERLMREAESISGMGCWEWSLAVDQVRISDQGLKIIGRSSPNALLTLQGALDLLHPHDRSRGRELVLKAIHDGGEFNEVLRLVRSNGELRWLQIQGKATCGEDGLASRITGVFLDITDRIKMSRRSEAYSKLGQLLSAAKTKREAARIVLGVAREIFEVEAAAFSLRVSKTSNLFDAILNADTSEGVFKEFEALPQSHSPTPLQQKVLQEGPQLILRKRENSESNRIATQPFGFVEQRSASIMAVPVRYKEECIGFFAIHSYRFDAYSQEDIPLLQSLADHSAGALLRVDAEEEAQRNHDLVRLVIDSLPTYVAYITPDHRYRLVNNKYENWLGVIRSGIEGRPIRSLLPDPVYQSQLRLLEASQQSPDGLKETLSNEVKEGCRHLRIDSVCL